MRVHRSKGGINRAREINYRERQLDRRENAAPDVCPLLRVIFRVREREIKREREGDREGGKERERKVGEEREKQRYTECDTQKERRNRERKGENVRDLQMDRREKILPRVKHL